MTNHTHYITTNLGEALVESETYTWNWLVFLPMDSAAWNRTSRVLIAPEEQVDDHDEHPDATKLGLRYAMSVANLQDVVANARLQASNLEEGTLVDALRFYFHRDAFMTVRQQPSS